MLKVLVALTLAMLACACATPASQADIGSSPWALASLPASPTTGEGQEWQHHTFPGKQPTRFHYVSLDGRDAIAVRADKSASMLRQPVRVEPDALGLLRFSWKVPALIEQADMALREADDAPVRIVLAFEGDRSRFSARDAMLSELARALTGEELPYATLMYVWSKRRAPEEVIVNPRTGRIRQLVVESGGRNLNAWLNYERNVRADYERVFGEPPGALVGVGLMTDTDNTRTVTRAWYGPLNHSGGVTAYLGE